MDQESLEVQLCELKQYKETMIDKYELYQQELEGMRNSNNEWEEILKNKNRELQKEKQSLEEELSEAKLHFK